MPHSAMTALSSTQDPTVALIEQRLAALEAELIQIYDESAEHVGHAGAASGGGHYQLIVVSRRFEGQTRVARHRLVYQALGDLMQRQIHALAITALTPEELREVFPE
jgi:BolA family transcriptional regulator, general stress-responsive regulator